MSLRITARGAVVALVIGAGAAAGLYVMPVAPAGETTVTVVKTIQAEPVVPVTVTATPKPVEAAPARIIMPCEIWADTSTPVLPKGAYTDRCAAPDGSISYAQH